MTLSNRHGSETAALCRLSDIPNPGSLEVEHQGQALFLVRFHHTLRLYRNRCPHRQVQLNSSPNQFLDNSGNLLQCASHGALFLIETGECVSGPCQGEFLEAVPITLRDGLVYPA